jgi:hypothetical protein
MFLASIEPEPEPLLVGFKLMPVRQVRTPND